MKGDIIMSEKNGKNFSVLRAVFITIGVIVTILAALLVIYKVFKKYFRITLECGDCSICDDDCFCDETDYEPECCVYDGTCCGDIDGIDDELAADIAENIADGMADAE